VLVFAGRAEEGIRFCTKAATAQPDSADAHFFLGASLEASGRRRAAVAEYRQALRLDAGHAKAAAALAKTRSETLR
jgi:Flp pilus assembly protein TadD